MRREEDVFVDEYRRVIWHIAGQQKEILAKYTEGHATEIIMYNGTIINPESVEPNKLAAIYRLERFISGQGYTYAPEQCTAQAYEQRKTSLLKC
ncbi:MAG: hypothetical protein A2Z21_00785 [Candidatus Fraserbacteria bacterium RBG_16_55_9]|uniref:Uncharacterized protein n=1 Tax=Fraserbacteria sp. (strain RBG_16_55_9) TaxID=1817864 RepID=A0A1F5UXM8_FRAXR|nr:MAG: hypothetical protein A2Z21_00785 [Candidatus Fraserbacteria bacterium RBG_16_55_9]